MPGVSEQYQNMFSFSEQVTEMPWLYLTCDLPAPPLYPDESRENIIPQVSYSVACLLKLSKNSSWTKMTLPSISIFR